MPVSRGRAAVLKQTNRCHNEAGNKCSGLTPFGKHSADQGPRCLARRSESLLEALQSLGGSRQSSSLLAFRGGKAVSVKGSQCWGPQGLITVDF